MFIGTPCQISALQNYLGKPYDNLYTIDFICHGVSSRYVFDKYLDFLNMDESPVSIRFRNKMHGYRNKKACFELQIEYPEKTVRKGTKEGVYYWFSSSLSVRESCYHCPFASTKRASDITLADYVGHDLSDTDDEIGVNTVFVNTQKGFSLLEKIKSDIVMESRDTEAMVKSYDHLIMSASKPFCRKAFFKELSSVDYLTLEKSIQSKKYCQIKW